MAGRNNTATIEAVEKLVEPKYQPAALTALLKREQLPTQIPQRGSKAQIERSLEKQGLLAAAQEWVRSFSAEAKICLPNRSIAQAREIAWRYVEMKATANRESWLSAVHIEQRSGERDAAAASLPIDIYWVYRHPLLQAVDADAVIERAGREYEAINPCPSNGARSRLNSARRDAKSIEQFMRYVDKLLAAATLAGKGKTVAGPTEIAEDEAIADLEVQLLQEMEAKLIELGMEADGEDEDDDEA